MRGTSKILLLLITFIICICMSGFSGFYLGGLDKQSTTNTSPVIEDMWISHYPYGMREDSDNGITGSDDGIISPPIIDIWPYPYPYYYAFNVEIKDYDNDVMSIKFFVKQNNHWVQTQEFFGRDGLYTLYPYYYEYPTYPPVYPPGIKGMNLQEVKIVISDNINTISREF